MIAIARLMHTLFGAALALGAVSVLAQGHPAPREGTWNARLHLIPASEQTAGHGTTGQAKWWAQELAVFLGGVPRRKP